MKEKIYLILIVVFFLAACFFMLEDAGTNGDICTNGIYGINVLTNNDFNLDSFYSQTVTLFGVKFPVGFGHDYTFALPSYLLIPFFILLGINLTALSSMSICAVTLMLPMFFYIIKRLFNREIAWITIILLATSPLFIHFTRIELSVNELLITFFLTGSVFLYLISRDTRNNMLFYLSALFLGLSLCIKISVFARLAGFAAASVIIAPGKTRNALRLPDRRRFMLALLFFLAGSGLFTAHNIKSGGAPFRLVSMVFSSAITDPGQDNNRNSEFMKNIFRRIDHLTSLVREEFTRANYGYPDMLNDFKPPFGRKLLLYIFLAGLAINPLYFLLRRKERMRKPALFIYVMFGVIFILSAFTPASARRFHMSIMYPFMQLNTALLIYILSRTLRSRTAILLAVAVPVILINLYILAGYYYVLSITGGNGTWSRYNSNLAEYIKDNRLFPAYTLGDHETTVCFILKGDYRNIYAIYSKMDFSNMLNVPGRKFLIYYPGGPNDGLLNLGSNRFSLMKTFRNMIGDMAFSIYEITPAEKTEKNE